MSSEPNIPTLPLKMSTTAAATVPSPVVQNLSSGASDIPSAADMWLILQSLQINDQAKTKQIANLTADFTSQITKLTSKVATLEAADVLKTNEIIDLKREIVRVKTSDTAKSVTLSKLMKLNKELTADVDKLRIRLSNQAEEIKANLATIARLRGIAKAKSMTSETVGDKCNVETSTNIRELEKKLEEAH
ncbi:hypothetical protein HDU99_005524 [Rhizoclosmatium hyalinum]|nr:hypothetical protein HDU99_005524 [Rhizoclosmatium hyalinum]